MEKCQKKGKTRKKEASQEKEIEPHQGIETFQGKEMTNLKVKGQKVKMIGQIEKDQRKEMTSQLEVILKTKIGIILKKDLIEITHKIRTKVIGKVDQRDDDQALVVNHLVQDQIQIQLIQTILDHENQMGKMTTTIQGGEREVDLKIGIITGQIVHVETSSQLQKDSQSGEGDGKVYKFSFKKSMAERKLTKPVGMVFGEDTEETASKDAEKPSHLGKLEPFAKEQNKGISRRITPRHQQQQQGMAIPKVISPIVTEGKVKSRWSDIASASVAIDTTDELKEQVSTAEEQKEITDKKETSSLEKKHEQFILGLTRESVDKDHKYRDERERDKGDYDGDRYDYREKRKWKDYDYERSSRHRRSTGHSRERSRDRSRDRSWDRERSRDMKDRDRRKGYDRAYDRGHSSRDKRYDRHYSSRDKDYGDRYRSRRKSKRDDKYYSDEDEYDDRYKDRRKRSHRDSDDDDERHRRDSRRRKSYKEDDSDSESHSEGESMSAAGATPLTNVGDPVYSQQTTSVQVSQQGQTLLPQPVPGQAELPPPPPSQPPGVGQPMVGQQMYPPSQQPVVTSQVYTQPSQTVPGVPPDQMYVQQPGQVMQGMPQEQQMYMQQNQVPQVPVTPDQQVYGAPNQMISNQMFEPSVQSQANMAQNVASQVFDPSSQQPNQMVPPQMFEQPGQQQQGVFPTNQQMFIQQNQPVDQPIMGQHQSQMPLDQPIMGQHQSQMPIDQPIMGQPPMAQMHPLNQNIPQHMVPEQSGPHGFVPPNQQIQNFLPGSPAEMHAFSQQQPKDRFTGGNRQQRFIPGNIPRPGLGMPLGPQKPSMQEQFPDMRRQMPGPRPLMKIQVKPPQVLQQSPDSRPSSTTGQKLVRQSSEESQKNISEWSDKKPTFQPAVNKKTEVSSIGDSAVGSSDEVVKKDNQKKEIDIDETSSKTPDIDTKKESEKVDAKEPEKSEKPEQQSQVTSSPLPHTQVTGLSIKLRMKQEFQAEKEMDQSTTPPQAQVKPEKVKSRWRRFSELDLTGNSPNADEVPSSTVEDITSEAPSDTEDLAAVKEDQKSGKTQESANYDAWDPASDISIQPAPPPPKKEFTKKEKKEKDKENVQNSDVTSGSAKPETTPSEKVPAPPKEEEEEEGKPPPFERIEENIYLGERKVSKKMKQVRRMLCDCTTSKEDREMGYEACGEDCLNRMLYIEWYVRQYSDVEPFQTDWKGFGLRANKALKAGQFIMEYVGEVLDYRQFKSRSKQYAKSGNIHHYFMALNADEVIDATLKGNISRFINHSCDPNSETQKWTVNGTLRVGFFVRKDIEPGTELTFDYQFESYGEAQRCFCGASNCRGILSTLKMLPITNKTVLKDSKILSIVERWAGDEDNGDQSSPSVSSTPVKDKDVPSILNITKDNKQTKKKVKFADETSSSDNESRTSGNDNFSDITGNDLYTDFEGSPNAQSPSKRPDSKSKKDIGVSELCRQVLDKKEPLLETLTKEFSQDSSSEDKGETSADSTNGSDNKESNLEMAIADSSSKEESPSEDLASFAAELLQHWSDLKEIFKIPKKQQVEERKRIERELTSSSNGRRMERFERSQDRYRHRVAGWDTGKKRKRSQPPPPPPPSSDDGARKSLLPTPPKMSKQERRELFEAQVKAQDEMMAEQQRQEQEAYLQYQQQVLNDPNYMFYQQDPNCQSMPGMPMHPGMMQTPDMMQPGMEPGMDQQFMDPSMAQQMMNPEQFAMAQHQQQFMEGQQPFMDMSQGQPQPDMYNQQMQTPFVTAQGITTQGQPLMQPNNMQVPQDQAQAMQAPVADTQFPFMSSSQGPVLQQQQQSQLPLPSNPAMQMNDPQNLAYLQQVILTLSLIIL
ncbi:hypothetical protein KUTeg_002496 [Tegillarca granosa]|uniref:Uncharacterized protein n=1 Tax=Tegillarca granosa TaxID=220873 RepID=A0ABQ9FUK7_TEGGR|nr:hypothetical protein KUTeg_002496 [Tegillarca granosa]